MRDTTPAPAHVVDNLQSKLGRSHIIRLLTAFLLAIVTWGWVIQATDPIETMTIAELEIAAPNLDKDMVIVTALPRASVEVEGPQSELESITRSQISVRLDTSSVTQPGNYKLPLVVDGPDTDARLHATPEFAQVQVDELATKVMPLQIDQIEQNPGSSKVNTITSEVQQVTVSGPSSAVDRVDSVILPVVIDSQTTNFASVFTPYAVDAEEQVITEVSILPNQISTQVEVKSRGKVISVIPSIQGQPAEGYSTQRTAVLPISVTVDGPEDVLANLLFVNTEPVDISGASQSVSQRVGLADLPEGVTIVEPASGEVEVRVAIQDSSATTQTLASLPINVLNVPVGFTASIEPETVDVTVQGSSATLSEMTAEEITVVVDVRGYEPGTYELSPVVALPNNGVTSSGINPDTVTVTISPASDVATPEPATATPAQTSDLELHLYQATETSRRENQRSGAFRLRFER